MPGTVLILAGGTTPTPHVQRALPPAAMCIAADSGIDHARALGRVPTVAVGDFDSVTPEGLAWATESGVEIERHPAAKDATDLELALERAVEVAPDRVVVAAIGGGRFDHLLANLLLLADRRYAAVPIDGLIDTALVSVVHGRRELTGEIGETISLLAANGDAEGVTTTGLGYPLDHDRLAAGASRGVSNYFSAETAAVTVERGSLLAIQPDRLRNGYDQIDGEHGPDRHG